MFELDYGFKNINPNYNVNHRLSIKGVAFSNNNNILLMLTNKGDYKFPGGGVKEYETLEQALYREILEETGYELIEIGSVIGKVTEIKIDQREQNTYFIMESFYVECSINYNNKNAQNLDEYEKKQNFKAMIINKSVALENNKALLNTPITDLNPWVQRETDVLERI